MKVKYIKTYTDEFNDTFECGWVAEHTDAEALRRIALGVCEEVGADTKALRYKVGAKMLVDECATEPAPIEPSPFQNSGPLVVASKSSK